MNKYLVATCAFNEGEKILRVIERFSDPARYDLLVIDDASSDGALERSSIPPHVTILRNNSNRGAGYCIRRMVTHAKERWYDAILFVSGNNKDDPRDLGRLRDALEAGADFVQGSRYLPGGQAGGAMPAYRRIATRVYPLLFSLLARTKVTDVTNGFRAIRLSLFDDPRIDLSQTWLDRYEMEPYLYFKAVTLGYKTREVPVTKIYPSREAGYTKMKPVSGWWSILRPLVFLSFGWRR